MKPVRVIITWFIMSGLGTATLSGVALGAGPPNNIPPLRILQSDSKTLLIELDLPDYSLEPARIDGRLYQSVSIHSFGRMSKAGLPQLPQRSWLVAVPAAAQLSLEVTAQQVEVTQAGRILPAPEFVPPPPASSMRGSSDPPTFVPRYEEDRSVYQAEAFYPPTIARLGERGRVRDQSFIQVVVTPIQYSPVKGVLRYTKSLKLKLTFEVPPAEQGRLHRLGPSQRAESQVFEELLSQALINYESGKSWQSSPELSDQPSNGSRIGAPTNPAYKISVDRDGIYELSYADLQAAGLAVEGIDPRTFRLVNQGHEVAIMVEGEADGRFDPSDAIIFFGEKVNTKYTDTNVYWLTFGGGIGKRMMEVASAPGEALEPDSYKATLHLERNLLYQSRVPAVEGGDHWFWNIWPSRDGSPLVYTAQLRDLASEPVMAILRAQLQGFTTDANVDPDHHLRLFLNGQLLQDVFFDDATENLAEVSFPQSLLVEGTNQIRIEVLADTGAFFDQGLVNWVEIDYGRRFVAVDDQLRFVFSDQGVHRFRIHGFTTNALMILDITNPTDPERLIDFAVAGGSTFQVQFQDRLEAGREYVVASRRAFLRPVRIEADQPSSLRSADNGADYIIITHGDFYDEVLPLSRHRATQRLRTMVVDVQDIYDEFSGGVFTAEAIRDFLAYAYANWQPPAPSYVLLVGDGTFDFKDSMKTGERNFIPPLLRLVSPFLGEAASDNRYVTISGDDILPDMLIGRLPVNTKEQARVVVNKILRYETEMGDGDWNSRVMFVAGEPDGAGAFNLLSDIVANQHLPPDFERDKVYVKVTHTTGAEARAAIVAGINRGRLIINYVGHSGIQLWAERTGRERYLEIDDLNSLTHIDRLPLVLSMSSVDGFFHFPGIPAISESFLRAEGKGAIAWWGGTGLGLSSGHHLMNVGFFDAVFRDGVTEIGRATTQGKMVLYQETGGEIGGFGFLIDTFVLLGDPALRLALPTP